MSDIKPEQIIFGIKRVLLSCGAVTVNNITALDNVLDNQVSQSIIDYGKQESLTTDRQKYIDFLDFLDCETSVFINDEYKVLVDDYLSHLNKHAQQHKAKPD